MMCQFDFRHCNFTMRVLNWLILLISFNSLAIVILQFSYLRILKKIKMKKQIILPLALIFLTVTGWLWYLFYEQSSANNSKKSFTNIVIRNSSAQDSVKVYVTLQAPNSVVGLFGIKSGDTIGSSSKGFFYARKDSSYSSNRASALLGVVIGFGGDNLPCQVAIKQGYPLGINIFECSINTAYEVFDISCEDGINSILRESVSDTVNWTTGQGDYVKNFRSAQDTFPLINNINRRGIFPYRCTDCIDLGKAVPENCFNLRDSCNKQRVCQVARTNHIGGTIYIEVMSLP